MTLAQEILVDEVRRALKVASKISAARRRPLSADELNELSYLVPVATERRFRRILIAGHENVTDDTVLRVDLPLAGGC